MAELLKTALHPLHVELGARMVPFAGYSMPVQYQGLIEEAKACRRAGGIFDVSHMGQFQIKGNGVFEKLQSLLTNDLSRLKTGKAQYSFLCTPQGGVIDDVVVYKLGENEAFICVNASNRLEDRDWILSHLPQDLQFEDLSDDLSLIAVQGPQSPSLIDSIFPASNSSSLSYYGVHTFQDGKNTMIISRTGYTGEDGFEIYLPSPLAPALWQSLLEKGKPLEVVPCGLGARDTLRLEMGYPLHGHELSQEISPLEAGLGWAVKLKESFSFIGKETLMEQSTQGVPRKLIPLLIQDKRLPRSGYPIAVEPGQPIGSITSGTFSPHLAAPIGLGFVASQFSDYSDFLIGIRDEWVKATRTSLPFVPNRTKKS